MRPASSESSQPRNDRRTGGGPRPTPRASNRQEWVPRGSAPVGGVLGHDPNPNHGSNHRPRHRPNPARQTFVPRPPPTDLPASEEHESVPQLVQEIQDKLARGAVECMICYDMVRRSAPIWSCSSCFSIFHLQCVRKWARSPTSADLSSIASSPDPADRGGPWRCPGCQSVQSTPSKDLTYTCFCGNRPDPSNDFYLTPHSCGEPCRKPLDRDPPIAPSDDNGGDRCTHICVLQCHPGPCPPCKALAPQRRCPCGKKNIVRRCSDRKSPLTCQQKCGRLLTCGRHRCDQVCHTQACIPCQALITASCFCKKKTEVLLCGDMSVKGDIKDLDGVFSCNAVCGRMLSCGNHLCNDNCHPGPCGECELLPQRVRTCHCGKTELTNRRESCLDPIPTCSEVCGKLLLCGIHRCQDSCHQGDCAPCLMLVNQKCRCGSSHRTVECYKALEERGSFVCDKSCGQKKNCGRHRCNERCCPLSKPIGQLSGGDWDPHLCSMPCGKRLRCGQHSCQLLCHSGHCPPCLETIFSDLSCACGKTSIPPPLPCGTPNPSCPHPCLVPQPCGHSASHTCHFGDCPPCSVPVAKECIGGHVLLRNIPCGSKDIRCNQVCGKTRQCGMHACARTCHSPPCDLSSGSVAGLKSSCGQVCGAPRRDCKHACTAPCHPSAPCPDLRCDFPVTIACSCGRITASVPCSAGGNGSGFHVDTVFEASVQSVVQNLPVPLLPVEANEKKVPLGQRKLSCDEDCTKLERKRVLAEAFDVTTPNADALHFGENSAASDLLADVFRRDPKWVLAVEERFKFLVMGKGKGGTANSLRVHVFCHASKEKRDAVRQIAERWKLSVQAAGWEPKRFLVVHVTPKSKPPARILGSKPGIPVAAPQHPSAFDPLVDMDPRLVVAMFDLPRDADISALVLRFGGECELVWLNDKNALAVFGDPARAATALRRLDHGSSYHGAVMIVQNGGTSGLPKNNAWVAGPKEGGLAANSSTNPWKKVLSSESDAWEGDWPSAVAGAAVPVQKATDAASISASTNRWNVLDLDIANPVVSESVEDPVSAPLVEGGSGIESRIGSLGLSSAGQDASTGKEQMHEEVENWEEAYE